MSAKGRLSLAAVAVRAVLAGALLGGSAPVAAAGDAERIAELERRIELMARRLGELEAARASAPAGAPASPATAQAGASPTAAPAGIAPAQGSPAADGTAAIVAAQNERIERLEASVVQASEQAATRADPGIALHGFADVGFARTSNDPTGRRAGFALGNLDLYMTPGFGDRIRSIIELVFEHGEQGDHMVDLERLQLGYTFSDALTTWVGRFHTPLGYWNAAFHHGAQLQTSVLRPRFLAFEDQGGVLPVHMVGLMASGARRAGQGRVRYDLYAGNGSRLVDGVLDFNAFKDDNRDKAAGANVRYQFGGTLEGLTLGAHGLTQQVDAYVAQHDRTAAPASRTRLNLLGAFAVYDAGRWEAIGEYYAFRNRDLSGATGRHASWAGFAQLGYLLGDGWVPFARIERAALDQSDPYFGDMASGRAYRRQALGLRLNLNPVSALKLELNRTQEDAAGAAALQTHDVRVQFAVRF